MTTNTVTDEEDFFAGVPTTPADLYAAMLFFLVLHLVGDCICARVLQIVPALVGYILVGIAFGPEGFDLLSTCAVRTFALLGNLGLILLIVQAGLEMDYNILRLVGLRGVVIAIFGTILPVTIGSAVASRYSTDFKTTLAAGCSFGPTSAGIAMNVLGRCRALFPPPSPSLSPPNAQDNSHIDGNCEGNHSQGETEGSVLQLPVGQLIVAAAIVDDILALVVLSQLQVLTLTSSGTSDMDGNHEAKSNIAVDIAIPILSAFLWLVAGGAIALWVFPKAFSGVLRRITLQRPHWKEANRDGSCSLAILFGLLFALLPATHFSRASYLLGAFLSGLAFCQDCSPVDRKFRLRFEQPLAFLMQLFFAASIGFQVPVRYFGDAVVIARGFMFSLALLGKLAVGFLCPNFYGRQAAGDEGSGDREIAPVTPFCGAHLRDCFVVGFSMMGEAEFAFVVAFFGMSKGLVPSDIYASIVWAILLSTLISPLLLKATLIFFPYRCKSDRDIRINLENKQDY